MLYKTSFEIKLIWNLDDFCDKNLITQYLELLDNLWYSYFGNIVVVVIFIPQIWNRFFLNASNFCCSLYCCQFLSPMNLYESMENDPIGVTHRSMENIFFFHLNLRHVYLHTIVPSPATPPCQVITNYYKGVFLLLTLPRNQGYFDRGNFRTKEGNIIVRKIHELDLRIRVSVDSHSLTLSGLGCQTNA